MSEIYISSTLLWGSPLPDLFRSLKDAGLAGPELWAQQFFLEKYDIGEYRECAAVYSLSTLVHACSWDLNLCSANEGIRTASIKEVIRSLELAKAIGAKEVTVHPGHMTMVCWRSESAKLLHRSLEAIADAARDLNIPFSLEIMEKARKEFVTSPQIMEEVTGDLKDRFQYTLDLAHCDSVAEMRSYRRQLRKRLSKLHISNRVGPQYHTPLPYGDYDYKALLPEILGWNVPMVVEGYDSTTTHEVFARNVRFLQEQGGLDK